MTVRTRRTLKAKTATTEDDNDGDEQQHHGRRRKSPRLASSNLASSQENNDNNSTKSSSSFSQNGREKNHSSRSTNNLSSSPQSQRQSQSDIDDEPENDDANDNANDNDNEGDQMKMDEEGTVVGNEMENNYEQQMDESSVYEFEGNIYNTYQEMVNAKRQRNQEMLMKSGLLDVAALPRQEQEDRKKKQKNKRAALKKSKQAAAPPPRKSKRLRGVEAENIYIEDERGGRFSFANSADNRNNASTNNSNEPQAAEEEQFYGNRINDGSSIALEEAVSNIDNKWLSHFHHDDDEDDDIENDGGSDDNKKSTEEDTNEKKKSVTDHQVENNEPKDERQRIIDKATTRAKALCGMILQELEQPRKDGGQTTDGSPKSVKLTSSTASRRGHSIGTYSDSNEQREEDDEKNNRNQNNQHEVEDHVARLSVGGMPMGSEAASQFTQKVVPDRIYSMTTHPSSDRIVACAGDKRGYVGIWNVTSRQQPQMQQEQLSNMNGSSPTSSLITSSVNGTNDNNIHYSNQNLLESTNRPDIHLFRFHTRPVTSLAWINGGASMLSTSYDSTCRLWDVETQTFTQVFGAYDDTQSQCSHLPGYGICSLKSFQGGDFWFQSACIDHRQSSSSSSDQGAAFFLSTSIGTVLHVDLRSPTAVTWNHQLSERKINSVSLHPDGNSFISSGLDCHVRLWDLRMFGTPQQQRGSQGSLKNRPSTPKPLAEYNGIRSINSAYFSPTTGKHVLVTTMNNRLDILRDFNLTSDHKIVNGHGNLKPNKAPKQKTNGAGGTNNDTTKSYEVAKKFPHDNVTGRWLATFMARWHPTVDDLFCVGSMEQPRNVHIYNTQKRLAAVPGLTAVVSRCCFHPSSKELILVGGNSSGRVTVVREQQP